MSSIEAIKARCQSEINLNEVQVQEMEISDGTKQLSELKSKLYSKFADAIRLDYD